MLLWCQSVFRSYCHVGNVQFCHVDMLLSCFPDMLLRWQSVILSCCYAAMFWAPNVVIVFVPCCNAILSCSLVKLSNSQSVMPPYCLAAQCPAAILFYRHLAMLPSCYTVIQPCCHVAQLLYSYSHVAMLPIAAILSCSNAAMLQCSHLAMPVMLPCCHDVILVRKLSSCYAFVLPAVRISWSGGGHNCKLSIFHSNFSALGARENVCWFQKNAQKTSHQRFFRN